MKLLFVILALAATLGANCPAQADPLKLPAIISDNMVLQQGIADPIWGWAEPGADVTVTIAGQTGKATADPKTGKWMLKLKPLKPGGPLEMTVASKSEQKVVKNILVGEVWVCSGQSNMDFSVGGWRTPRRRLSSADYPQIRHFCDRVCRPRRAPPRTARGSGWCARRIPWPASPPSGICSVWSFTRPLKSPWASLRPPWEAPR